MTSPFAQSMLAEGVGSHRVDLRKALVDYALTEDARIQCRAAQINRLRMALRGIASGNLREARTQIEEVIQNLGGAL